MTIMGRSVLPIFGLSVFIAKKKKKEKKIVSNYISQQSLDTNEEGLEKGKGEMSIKNDNTHFEKMPQNLKMCMSRQNECVVKKRRKKYTHHTIVHKIYL